MNHEKFLKYSSALFIATGLILLLGPKSIFPSFYHPIFLGIFFLLSPFLAYIPVPVLKKDESLNRSSLLRIRSSIAFALLINNTGELGLFKMNVIGFEYDKFAHFLVCMLFAFMLGEYLTVNKKLSFQKVVMTVMTSIFVSGLIWELFEASSDIFFHTEEWGIYGRAIFPDTMRDIFFNTIGIVTGIILLSFPSPTFKKDNKSERVTGIEPVA